jgi:DNA-binding GntR family transcriptional regulator
MSKEALKLALEALYEYVEQHGQTHLAKRAMLELREDLAQPEQEPVAKLKTSDVLLRCHRCGYSDKLTMQVEYTTPPQRTWVGLTDEEAENIHANLSINEGEIWMQKLIRSIEAKLKEKNT